jgi:isopentenyl-diphosphate delta-isomerase
MAKDMKAKVEPLYSVMRDEEEQVICVDRDDRCKGPAGKLDAHRRGLLHRAFSILVFNDQDDLLLQRRADCKYHFAGRWSNTCCGHPRPGEGTAAAAARRLREEMGFGAPLEEHTQLVYRAEDPVSSLIEHEYLHVFRGVFTGEPRPNPSEVGSSRWISLPELTRELSEVPDAFTPWFLLLIDLLFAPERRRGQRLVRGG